MRPWVKNIINQLDLTPHPEGGFYRETYRSDKVINKEALNNFSGDRNYSTCIYFLLTSESFSALHRIKQDEIWHFYSGSPLYVHVIHQGEYTKHQIGSKLDGTEVPQLIVPAGAWFGASVKNNKDYSLVGCTVAPGFDFQDFELAKRESLTKQYPKFKDVINNLTRV